MAGSDEAGVAEVGLGQASAQAGVGAGVGQTGVVPEAIPVTVLPGDGIGPEIMGAVLDVLREAGARLHIHELGLQGRGAIPDGLWESLRQSRVLLKGPITTPQGGGHRSLSVQLRTTLALYANVRPCFALAPYVATRHPGMDVVIVRENQEDTYGGLEYRQTPEMAHCLKLSSRPGCERIARYAFEYARRHGRGRVTCLSKDNIMKLTDGLFHRVFGEVAQQYPEIQHDHLIVDIGAARLADRPEEFDVIVTANLYGDILSDIAAELAGSVGMAGSANIGPSMAMFEAIHGSAPTIAGMDVANPSGLLQAAVMMLEHVGQGDVAQRVQSAWLCTIEQGVHTADIASSEHTRETVGTRAFAQAIVSRLGQVPERLRLAGHSPGAGQVSRGQDSRDTLDRTPEDRTLVGVDMFLHWDAPGRNPTQLGRAIEELALPSLRLESIFNRGVTVYPRTFPETVCVDEWGCRFTSWEAGTVVEPGQIAGLLQVLVEAGFEVVRMECLYQFGSVRGY